MTTEPEIIPAQALAVRNPGEVRPEPLELPMATRPKTAQELRVVEVSEALAPAYQKASTLELTEAEIDLLMAPFDDLIIEIRPHDGLIYIPHIFISDRLNRVFKPGKWALVCRRHWIEGITMYGEYILLIRGCFIGESVGGHPYQPTNPKVNYSDTLESTAAEALRRIAGKRLSCGSQVWNPEYARQWVAKYAVQAGGKWSKRAQAASELGRATTTPLASKPTPQSSQQAPLPAVVPKVATAATRAWMIDQLKAAPGSETRPLVLEYFVKSGALLPDSEQLEDLPLQYVPTNKAELIKVSDAIAAFERGEEAKIVVQHAKEAATENPKPAPAKERKPAKDDEAWRDVIVPIPHKGQKRADYLKNPDTIGGLFDLRHGNDEESQAARQRLWGFCQNYEPKGWTKRDGTVMPPNDADIKFAAALTAFKAWFAANHPEEKL